MANNQEIGFITVRSEYNVLQIPYENIMYIESKKGFVTVHTSREKIICNTPLRLILYQLPVRLFIQTHMYCVVAISEIDAIEPSKITLINEEKIPLAKPYRQKVIDLMVKIGVIEKGF